MTVYYEIVMAGGVGNDRYVENIYCGVSLYGLNFLK